MNPPTENASFLNRSPEWFKTLSTRIRIKNVVKKYPDSSCGWGLKLRKLSRRSDNGERMEIKKSATPTQRLANFSWTLFFTSTPGTGHKLRHLAEKTSSQELNSAIIFAKHNLSS